VWKLFSEQRQVRASVSVADSVKVLYSFGAGAAHWTNTYQMTAGGVLRVKRQLHAAARRPARPAAPRPALRQRARAGQLRWYGRGPQESYADRKTGYALGLYEGKLADQYHGYIRPQESGNKTDVRWLSLFAKRAGRLDGAAMRPGR
jgi:beta-galactosidase